MELRQVGRGVLTVRAHPHPSSRASTAPVDVVIGVGGDDPPQALVRYRAATETLETIVETGATFTRLWHPFFHGGFGFNDSGPDGLFCRTSRRQCRHFHRPRSPTRCGGPGRPRAPGSSRSSWAAIVSTTFGQVAYWHNGRIVLASPDVDQDRVADVADLCPATVWPEAIPTDHLRPAHYALLDGNRVFNTRAASGEPRPRRYTLTDTGGCSCTQIIAALGLGDLHERFGCSALVMRRWVRLLPGPVPPPGWQRRPSSRKREAGMGHLLAPCYSLRAPP